MNKGKKLASYLLSPVFLRLEPAEHIDSGFVEESITVLAPLHHHHRMHALLVVLLFEIILLLRHFFRRLSFPGLLRQLAAAVASGLHQHGGSGASGLHQHGGSFVGIADSLPCCLIFMLLQTLSTGRVRFGLDSDPFFFSSTYSEIQLCGRSLQEIPTINLLLPFCCPDMLPIHTHSPCSPPEKSITD